LEAAQRTAAMRVGAAFAAAAVVVLALGPRAAFAGKVEVENGVYKLEESNFDSAIKKYPVMLVEFYAPWCGHCKALKPKFEKAAKELKKVDSGPRLGKVDATVETKLAEKYEVSGYPTLMIFKDGELHGSYNGARTKSGIVQYMQSFSYPMPLGVVMRGYYLVSSIATEVYHAAVPKKFRKYVIPSLVAVVALVVATTFVCMKRATKTPATDKGEKTPASDAKAGDSAAAKPEAAPAAKEKKRSASPGRTEATAGKADEVKATDEKKED